MAFVMANSAFAIWMATIFGLFLILPKHRVIILAFVISWQFLPEVSSNTRNEMPPPIVLPMFKVTKTGVSSLVPILAVLLFDLKRVLAFRPRWFDVPMFAMCLTPLVSALTNEPPPDGTSALKDGLTGVRMTMLEWGSPYFLGRLYLSERRNFDEMVVGCIIAGLLYVPFCLAELRIGPTLNYWIYGYHQHSFEQSLRGDGYRPIVFMEHGLAVAFWMVSTTTIAFWLFWTGAMKELSLSKGSKPISMPWVVVTLIVTSILMKSTGALVVGFATVGAMTLIPWRVGGILLVGLLMVAPMYCLGRVTASQEQIGWMTVDWDREDEVDDMDAKAWGKPMLSWAPWSSQSFLDFLEKVFSARGAQSFGFRLMNEDRLMERWREHYWFGWSGWNRSRIFNDRGEDMTTADGLWIIVLGDRGIVGLVLVYAVYLLPVARFMRSHPIRTWTQPANAGGAAVAVILIMYMIDCVSNAMHNPIYLLMTGALNGIADARSPAPAATVARTENRRQEVVVTKAAAPRPVAGRPGVRSRPRPQ